MQRYSKFEIFISGILKYCPLFKAFVKRCYYLFCSVLYSKPYTVKTEYSGRELNKTDIACFESTFFGYYDKSPWNSTCEKLAFHGINYPSCKLPDPAKPLSIIVKDPKLSGFEEIAKSYAWNWQQGSRLCWFSDSELIFNDYSKDQDSYISKIIDINTGKARVIQYPINDIYKNVYGLSLNYDRLERLRPDYGYKNRPHAVKALKPADQKDGIWRIDFDTGKAELIVSLSQLSDLDAEETMNNAWHKVNHIMIGPEGDKFIFLHRWYNGSRKFSRLILSNNNGTELLVLPYRDMVSHCCWLNNNEVLSWARYDNRENYFIADVTSHKVRALGEFEFLGDGHPSISPDRQVLVTDTYPDKYRMRYLILYYPQAHKTVRIGEFYESLRFVGQNRCDLHPRWSPDGKNIAVDTVYNGKRSLTIVSLENVEVNG